MDNDFDCKTVICYEDDSISIVFNNRVELRKLIWRLIKKHFDIFGNIGVTVRIRPLYCKMFPKNKARCTSC